MEVDLEAIMDLLDKWDIHLKMRYIESARNPADYFTLTHLHALRASPSSIYFLYPLEGDVEGVEALLHLY